MLSELDNYLQRIEDLRGQVRNLIADLPAEALNWRPIPPLSSPPRAGENGGGRPAGGGERGGANPLAGGSEGGANPLAGGSEGGANSLAVLAAHIAGAEHFWIAEVIGGRPTTRDRDAEFVVQVADAAELVRRLEASGTETRAVFSALTVADLDSTREARGRTVNVRWGILHVIDHTALHLGHMQITYQLWRGGQGKPSPFWHERLPNP